MCGCATCAAGPDEVRGHFAQLALLELRADPTYGRRVTGLARMFPGDAETPL